ncbi:hypothetical protein [Sphingomonas sp. Leaf38]|uniref:hypothetical protein n=1 Tax=Sphingomonas sp. Leaf38 TaxID=1736217 RepID=UPI0007013AD2|nr:hypothetical protein [Sphingomonas sp. Leaf38]KQN31148.1 hypothetical protein ASE88_06000 [Sphingomonas sp. Leaf38]
MAIAPDRFGHFAAIDWSGAVGPRQSGIAVAICTQGSAAPTLITVEGGWSRAAARDWLADTMPRDTLVGLDLGPSLPFVDRGEFFPGWSDSPADARSLWALVERICADDPHLGASSFVDHDEVARHLRRHGGRKGEFFDGRGRLRVTEEAQRRQGLSPTSNLNLVGAAQVGKSSLTGMRVLHRLADRIPVWPFDPLPPHGPTIVEIYTTIAARAAGMRKGLSKIRDGASLDTALAALGSAPHVPLARYDDHATDAILTAAWLRSNAYRPELWSPTAMTPHIAQTEGWTFGVS